MAPREQIVTQTEIKRFAKAVRDAGFKTGRLELPNGIVLHFAGPEVDPVSTVADTEPTSAPCTEKNEWDSVK